MLSYHILFHPIQFQPSYAYSMQSPPLLSFILFSLSRLTTVGCTIASFRMSFAAYTSSWSCWSRRTCDSAIRISASDPSPLHHPPVPPKSLNRDRISRPDPTRQSYGTDNASSSEQTIRPTQLASETDRYIERQRNKKTQKHTGRDRKRYI